MNWHVAYYINSKTLPRQAHVAVLIALSWADPVEDGVVLVRDYQEKQAKYARYDGDLIVGLRLAVAAGWLGPIEELPDGSIRTSLCVPEGVAP